MIEAVVLKPVALEPDAISDIDVIDNFQHIVNDIVIDINEYCDIDNFSDTECQQQVELAEHGAR